MDFYLLLKIQAKKIIHKTSESTGDLIGNKIADEIAEFSRT